MITILNSVIVAQSNVLAVEIRVFYCVLTVLLIVL